MKHLRGLVAFTLLLPDAARRTLRLDNLLHDAHQQNTTRTKAIDMSTKTRETFLPGSLMMASFRGRGPRASTSMPRAKHLKPYFVSLPHHVRLHATVALDAASGPREDKLPPKETARIDLNASNAAAAAAPPLDNEAKELSGDAANDEDNQFYNLRFDGVQKLYGNDALMRLRKACVIVVGLGGVGSWAVEALARSGVGSLVLVDLDEICISNTNRQLHALKHTVGKSKARVLAERVNQINPECEVNVREQFVFEDDAFEVLCEEAQRAGVRNETVALLDACDGTKEKAAMVMAAHRLGMHMVLCGAAGGKADPTAIRCADLTRVNNDALLRQVRQTLRKVHGFPASELKKSRRAAAHAKWGVACVYSGEKAKPAEGDVGTVCDRFGTACFVTGAFGFAAAAQLVASIARGDAPSKGPQL